MLLVFFGTLLMLVFFTNVYGKAREYKPMTRTSTSDSDKIKFGVHLNSIISFHKVGGFVEYKMNEAIGLQTGLLLFDDSYAMKSLRDDSNLIALVNPSHVSVPLIARFYPGEKGNSVCLQGCKSTT